MLYAIQARKGNDIRWIYSNITRYRPATGIEDTEAVNLTLSFNNDSFFQAALGNKEIWKNGRAEKEVEIAHIEVLSVKIGRAKPCSFFKVRNSW